MPLPPIVSCFSKIQIGFTFLVPAHPGRPGKKDRPLNARARVCVESVHELEFQWLCQYLLVLNVGLGFMFSPTVYDYREKVWLGVLGAIFLSNLMHCFVLMCTQRIQNTGQNDRQTECLPFKRAVLFTAIIPSVDVYRKRSGRCIKITVTETSRILYVWYIPIWAMYEQKSAPYGWIIPSSKGEHRLWVSSFTVNFCSRYQWYFCKCAS